MQNRLQYMLLSLLPWLTLWWINVLENNKTILISSTIIFWILAPLMYFAILLNKNVKTPILSSIVFHILMILGWLYYSTNSLLIIFPILLWSNIPKITNIACKSEKTA